MRSICTVATALVFMAYSTASFTQKSTNSRFKPIPRLNYCLMRTIQMLHESRRSNQNHIEKGTAQSGDGAYN